jgi:hypothetical protein
MSLEFTVINKENAMNPVKCCAVVRKSFFVVFLLFMINGCATMTSANRTVEYYSLSDYSYRASSLPVKISTETDQELYAKGFARIGTLAVVQVRERCLSSDSKNEKCEKIPHNIDPTAELLQEAAGRGGEIVTILEDVIKENKATAGKRCAATAPVRSYSTMVYSHGQYKPGYVSSTECVAWEQTLAREERLVSSGILWRTDPQLARTQRNLERLVTVASSGNLNSVRNIIEQGIPADSRDPSGIPILGWAAGTGHRDIVDYLLTKGAKLDSSDYLMSPLRMAAEAGNEEMLRHLVARGAKVDSNDRFGSTPLAMACLKQQTSIVKTLLDAGADVGAKNGKGITPLMSAVMGMKEKMTTEPYNKLGQDPEIPRLLLEKGASLTTKDDAGNRVLEYAAQFAEHGKSAAFILNRQMGAYGYIDKKGKWVIKPTFQWVSRFSEGLAAVKGWHDVLDAQKTGFIDKSGTMVIPPLFRFAFDFHEGLAVASIDNKKHGFIDKTGRFVIEPVYGSAGSFSEGLAAVGKDGKTGYINRKGKIVITPQFNSANVFSNGIAIVGIKDSSGKNRYGFINKKGTWVIAAQFEDLTRFSDGMAAFRQTVAGKQLWGFIDKKGTMVIPAQFSQVGGFSEGLACFKDSNSGLWGYIDKERKIAIPPRFSRGYPFTNGTAIVHEGSSLNSKIRIINRSGQTVGTMDYDDMSIPFDGLAIAEKSNRLIGNRTIFYLDPTGKEVLKLDEFGSGAAKWSSTEPTIFTLSWDMTPIIYADNFSEGLAPVRVQGDVFMKAWR